MSLPVGGQQPPTALQTLIMGWLVHCHDSDDSTFFWFHSLCGGRYCFSTNTEAARRTSPVSAVGVAMSWDWVLGTRGDV